MRNPRVTAGASNRPATEEEFSEPKTAASQTTLANSVSTFAPWCDETELGLRIRVHRARDSATARATRCKHAGARDLYWLAAQLASERVFARMSNEELKETIDNLARLFLTAGWIERADTRDAE